MSTRLPIRRARPFARHARPVRPAALLAALLAFAFLDRAGAQSGSPDSPGASLPLLPKRVSPSPRAPVAPEVALANGVFQDDVLRDPVRASEWYRLIISDSGARPHLRQEAMWRLARSVRRQGRPDEARALLSDLLRDATLPPETRAFAEAELAAMPVVEPARLMPANTLVYFELADPGRFAEQVRALLRAAGLDDPVRRELVYTLLSRGGVDVGALLNEPQPAEVGRLEGVGIGFYNCRFEEVEGRRVLSADVLLVLYTGQDVAGGGVLQGLALTLLTPEGAVAGIDFFSPAGRPKLELLYTSDRGLFIACSDANGGADAVRRHRGELRDPVLFSNAGFRRRPFVARRAATPMLFVDWPRFVELMIESVPPDQREELTLAIDALGLRELGPFFATLSIEGDRVELSVSAHVAAPGGSLYKLLRTEMLDARWLTHVPDSAALGFVTALDPGEQRWRDFERLLIESNRARRVEPALPPSTRPFDDPLAGIRAFEQRAALRVADDVGRPLRGATLVWLGPAADGDAITNIARWILVFHVEQADLWLRRIELGLRRFFFGPGAEAELPSAVVHTPHGDVFTIPVPGTGVGPAWHVRGEHVVIAYGIDPLMEYLGSLRGGADAAIASGTTSENKLGLLRLDRLVNATPGVRAGGPIGGGAPLVVRTYESDDRFRIVLQQNDATAAIRAAALLLWPELMAAETAPHDPGVPSAPAESPNGAP
ncbi:MAG: hypothetical protein AB7Q17_02300 [Phycisphaerae bacterium]